MTALSARMNRRHLLVALMAVFMAGNLVSAAAQDVQLLIATRLITAVAHAVIASVAAALAINLVDESKQARAISAWAGARHFSRSRSSAPSLRRYQPHQLH